jgi:hypothetical protein
MTGSHIVLLGDSIFDNASYVPGGLAVMDHLLRQLPSGWQATLIAVDGAVVESVYRQMERLPRGATHFVLSVGGNNVLWSAGDLLRRSSKSVPDALSQLAPIVHQFASEYLALVDELLKLNKPLAICTIYDAIPNLEAWERIGLTAFNDAITRTAWQRRLPWIDLRVVCNEASDYSSLSPIEPSAQGGQKIAQAIVNTIAHEWSTAP